jgi:hypothetical protein
MLMKSWMASGIGASPTQVHLGQHHDEGEVVQVRGEQEPVGKSVVEFGLDDACDDDDLVDVCSESLLLVKAVARAGAAEFAFAGENADNTVFLGADSRTVVFAVVDLAQKDAVPDGGKFSQFLGRCRTVHGRDDRGGVVF